MLLYKCPKCNEVNELYGDHLINMRFNGDGEPNPSDLDITAVELFAGTRVLCNRCTYSGPLDDFHINISASSRLAEKSNQELIMNTEPGALAIKFISMYPQYANLWDQAKADCTGEMGTDLAAAQDRLVEFLDDNDIIHFVGHGSMVIFNDSMLRRRYADGCELSGSEFVHLAEKYRLPLLDAQLKDFILENVCAIRRDKNVMLNDITPGNFWKLFASLELALVRHKFRCPRCGEYNLFWSDLNVRHKSDHTGEATVLPSGNRADLICTKTMTCQVCEFSGKDGLFLLPHGELYTLHKSAGTPGPIQGRRKFTGQEKIEPLNLQ